VHLYLSRVSPGFRLMMFPAYDPCSKPASVSVCIRPTYLHSCKCLHLISRLHLSLLPYLLCNVITGCLFKNYIKSFTTSEDKQLRSSTVQGRAQNFPFSCHDIVKPQISTVAPAPGLVHTTCHPAWALTSPGVKFKHIAYVSCLRAWKQLKQHKY
jgi:hypothetical protein